MRIGLFTDTYRPSINGIVYVVESLKRNLEAEGHEVYVFCPAKAVRTSKAAEKNEDDEYIIRFPSLKGAFFDDYDTSLFFPPRASKQISELELDIIHVFTPSQIGLLGVRTAVKHDIPFVMQHCTDLYEFAEHYPATFPGVLGLCGILLPSTVKLDGRELREVLKFYRPRRGVNDWNKAMISKAITMLYSKADATIALCRKSVEQLESWQDEDFSYPVDLMPNGVDALPVPTQQDIEVFREKYNITENDKVFGFVGRLGEEKNLAVLIDAFEIIADARDDVKLLFVGDFEYRAVLEEKAVASGYQDRIIFTGALPRETLGAVYASMNVFVFPSLKDTQGWVLHEAAHAGLPIVLIDRMLSEVVEDGKNGFFADNTAESIAKTTTQLLLDTDMCMRFGAHSKKLAAQYSEQKQIRKLIALYENVRKNN